MMIYYSPTGLSPFCSVAQTHDSVALVGDCNNVVRVRRWCRSAGGGRNEGPRRGAGSSSVVRPSRDIGGKGVQLPRPGHPTRPISESESERQRARNGTSESTYERVEASEI